MPDFHVRFGKSVMRFRDPFGLIRLYSTFLMANSDYEKVSDLILGLLKDEYLRIHELKKTKEGKVKINTLIINKERKFKLMVLRSAMKIKAYEDYSLSNLSSRILDMLSRPEMEIKDIIKFRDRFIEVGDCCDTNRKGWKILKKLKKKDFISTREKIVELMSRSFGSRKMIVRMGFQKIEQSKTRGTYDDFKKPPRKIEKK